MGVKQNTVDHVMTGGFPPASAVFQGLSQEKCQQFAGLDFFHFYPRGL